MPCLRPWISTENIDSSTRQILIDKNAVDKINFDSDICTGKIRMAENELQILNERKTEV